MKYFEVEFTLNPCAEAYCDILSADLADTGFETFTPTENGLRAYVQCGQWNEEAVQAVIHDFMIPGIRITYTVAKAPDEDWNRVWEEEGFKPVQIGDEIVIHDVKHTEVPQVRYDIVITPRQAFGTGSHPTTQMILRQLCELNPEGLDIVDAGTGTGILSILCVKRGARHVLAYDIDEWSTENTRDNLLLNGIHNEVEVRLGDASVLANEHDKDLLIANINRNILLNDMTTFRKTLKPDGKLLLSGFYQEDVPYLMEKAGCLGMRLLKEEHDVDWTMLLLEADAAGRMNV